MKIRKLLEQLASDAAFAEAGLQIVSDAVPVQCGKRRCLVAYDSVEASPGLSAFAFSMAERMLCDLLMARVQRAAPSSAFPASYPPPAAMDFRYGPRGVAGGTAMWLRLRGEFFYEVQRLCSGNRRLHMAILQCAEDPPASFRLDVPYFLFN